MLKKAVFGGGQGELRRSRRWRFLDHMQGQCVSGRPLFHGSMACLITNISTALNSLQKHAQNS
jgi:hypothetical protein